MGRDKISSKKISEGLKRKRGLGEVPISLAAGRHGDLLQHWGLRPKTNSTLTNHFCRQFEGGAGAGLGE